jgi:hypothetical protein
VVTCGSVGSALGRGGELATRTRKAAAGALVLAALAALVIVQAARATHPRPKSATSIKVALLPAYEQCTSPNRTHGPPLAFDSCSPPVQTSQYLTVGTPDANSAGANSTGSYELTVVGDPAVPGGTDVVVTQHLTDVRCRPATSADVCNSPNAADGPDYSGEVQSNATIRITDHNNAVAPGGGTDAATVIDIPFPVTAPCINTSSTAIGGLCSIDTSFQAVRPGLPESIRQKRAVIALTQVQVDDGGADGKVATGANTLFAVQGIFIP